MDFFEPLKCHVLPCWFLSPKTFVCKKDKWIVSQGQGNFSTDLLQAVNTRDCSFILEEQVHPLPRFEIIPRTFMRESFFITFLFKLLDSCASRALKDNNGFTCWIRLQGIIYSSQLASLLRSIWIKDKGSDLRSFFEQSPRFSNIWISRTIILLKKLQASIRYKRLYFFTKKYKDIFQL